MLESPHEPTSSSLIWLSHTDNQSFIRCKPEPKVRTDKLSVFLLQISDSFVGCSTRSFVSRISMHWCFIILSLLAAGAVSAEQPAGQLKPRAGLKPFKYVKAPGPLPNYTPHAQWGTQGDPIRMMQEPLEPADSIAHLVTLPEFEVRLFAAEPDVI